MGSAPSDVTWPKNEAPCMSPRGEFGDCRFTKPAACPRSRTDSPLVVNGGPFTCIFRPGVVLNVPIGGNHTIKDDISLLNQAKCNKFATLESL